LFGKFIDQIFNVLQRLKGLAPSWKFIDATREARTPPVKNHPFTRLTCSFAFCICQEGAFWSYL